MNLKNDAVVKQLIEELNWFAVGKTIDAIVFDPDAEQINGFNIFFDDESALLIVAQGDEVFWKCATPEEMKDFFSTGVDE